MRVKSLGAVAALIACLAVVVAVPASGDDSTGATSLYVVQLVQAPVATYGGGTPGYAATKPAKGKKIRRGLAAAAQSYAGYSERDSTTARSAGWRRRQGLRLTAIFNGFAAQLTAEQAVKLELLKGRRGRREGGEVCGRRNGDDRRSSDAFLHLSDNGGLWDQARRCRRGGLGTAGAGEDVVFGDVDGGYWPENPRFCGPQGRRLATATTTRTR